MNFYGTRKSSFNHVLGGAPPSRPSRVYRPTRACRRVFVVVAPDTRPIVPARRFEALHRRQLCTAPRRRRFAAMTTLTLGFGAAVAPASFRARVPARRAPSRPHHARARAKSRTKRCDPPRAPPSRRDVLFLFLGVCRPREVMARAAIRGARRLHFVSSLPDPLPLRDPSTSPPRARRSSPWAPRCSSAPRSRFPAPPPPRHPTCTLASAAPPGPSPPPSSSAAPHRHPPRRRSSPPSAPRRFRVQRQVLVQRFDTSRNGSRRRSSRRWRRFCSRGRAPRGIREGRPRAGGNDPNSDSKTPPRSSNRR